MTNRRDDMDDVIGKVLSGEANAEETALVDQWLNESNENRKYFTQLETIFKKAAANSIQLQFDEDAAWQKIKTQIHKGKKSWLFPASWSTGMMLRMAAGLAIFAATAVFIFSRSDSGQQQVAIQSTQSVVNDTLPDGSLVVLNKQTEIAYRFDRKSNTHQVKLEGEAFFDVRHEEGKPLLIESGDVMIRDIGTTFNVKAYPGSDTVEVYVESGEVQFYTLKNPGLHLKAGEVGIYNKSIKEFSRISQLDTNALAYKTKIFSFNNTELRAAIEILNTVYDSKIVLANESISHCRLTVNFNNDKIEDIADIIAETLNLMATKKDKEWVLDGTGCNNN